MSLAKKSSIDYYTPINEPITEYNTKLLRGNDEVGQHMILACA